MVRAARRFGGFFNKVWLDYTGLPIEQAVGLGWLQALHPSETEWYQRAWRQSVEIAQPFEAEQRLRGADGAYRHFLTRATPFLSEQGDVMKWYAALTDISVRREAEEKLALSELKYRSVVETMDEGMLLIDYDWRYLYINPAGEIQGRRPKEELIGRTVMECWPGVETTEVFMLEQKVMRERVPARFEGSFTFPDGEERWFEWRIQPVETGLLLITQDITERVRQNDLLRENDRFRLSTLNALQAHIAVLDQYGVIVAVNQAWIHFANENSFGQVYESMGGNYLDVCDAVPDDSPEATMSRSAAKGIRAVIRGEQPRFEMEYPCDSPQERRWFYMRVNRFSGEGPVYVTVSHEDISKVKLAQERLEVFFNLVPDMVCVASTNGYFQQVNNEWERVLGYTRQELLGRPFTDFIHPEDVEATLKTVVLQIAGQGIFQFINRYQTNAGSYRILEWYASPSPDGTTLYAAARDITERKQAEDNIRRSREELLKYAAQAPGMLYQFEVGLDGKMRLPFVSDGIQDLFGLNPADARDDFAPMGQRIHPDDVIRMGGLIEQSLLNNQPYQDIFRIVAPERPLRWAWAKSMPERLSDGRILFHGIMLDISERIAAEQALRDSEARFSSLFRISPIGINIIRMRDECLIECNDAYLDLIGYSRDEVMEHPTREINLFVNPQERQSWIQAVREQGLVRNLPAALRRKSGEVRYTIASMATFEMQGETHIVILVTDVTSFKKIEATLLLAQIELEKRVAARTAELRITN